MRVKDFIQKLLDKCDADAVIYISTDQDIHYMDLDVYSQDGDCRLLLSNSIDTKVAVRDRS